MIAFDADVLSDVLAARPSFSHRAAQIPIEDQAIPIIVIEEVLRGRFNAVRKAEAAKSKVSLPRAYELLGMTLHAFRHVKVLQYSTAADDLYKAWRSQGMRGGAHDLRIAAICVECSATLVTRNGRDFEKVPGLSLDIWT